MSKSSELDKTVKLYILDSIDADGYGKDTESMDSVEKIRFLRSAFLSEYGHNIARVGELSALRDWLQGLPSSINIVFTNYDIEQLAIAWGSLEVGASDSQVEKIVSNYWGFMANKILQLFNGYHVPSI